MIILVLPFLLFFPGISILVIALLFLRIGISKRRFVFASFVAFGILSGLMLASSKNSEGLYVFNFIGDGLANSVYDYSIGHLGDPHSVNGHYSIPWVLRIPQVRLFTSAIPFILLGVVAQFVYNRIKKLPAESTHLSPLIIGMIILICLGASTGLVYGLQSEGERSGPQEPYAFSVMHIEVGKPLVNDWQPLDKWVVEGFSNKSYDESALKESSFEVSKDIRVSVDVRNPSLEKGIAEVDLSVDGKVLASRSVGILSDETVTVQFDLIIPKEGTYILTVGDPPQVTETINAVRD